MKLYHFTDLWFLQNGGTILAEGLKPAVDKQGIEQPPYGFVWLTSQDDCSFASREPECVIKLFIPPNDKRLVRWETWLRQHDEHGVLAAAEQEGHERGIRWQSWYCY